MKKPYYVPAFVRHLTEFCTDTRGPVMHRIGGKRKWRYRFNNPLMQPLVLMKGIVDKRIDEVVLEEEAKRTGIMMQNPEREGDETGA
jgi:hypothetical protein